MNALASDLSAFVVPETGAHGRLELLVRGAHCASCLAKVERAAASAPGVREARLNLTTGKLTVGFETEAGDVGAVIEAVEDAGYHVSLYDPGAAKEAQDVEGRRLALALGVAAFGAGNVMMFSVPVWAGLFGQELEPGTRTVLYWMAALVATPCALFAGQPFFQSAWRSLRRGRANMDVPISIGVLLTLAVSFSETLQGGRHAYFDAAVTLLFLLLIGRWLDHQLRARALNAAQSLLALQTPIVRLVDGGGERGAPLSQVAVGDLIAVLPGERIPVDGVVASGRSSLNNALITGETAPCPIGPGAIAHAGALNLEGRLQIWARARAEDSTLAEIARLMEAGAQAKSAYVRLADRAASIYVPVVHSLALATFLGGWALGLGPREALLRAAAVLIITCPCALGLAVPAVQIAASARLFRKGVLVKSGAALERLAEVDWVAFDKTGVLTEGAPELVGPPGPALADAAQLARATRHPLAQALARAAGPGPVAQDVVEVAGQGVSGLIDGRRARLGRANFVGSDTPVATESELWFQFDGETPTQFIFKDSPRPDAADAVAALRKRGIGVEILSGDVRAAVARVAETVAIPLWRYGLTPVQKAAAIDEARARGRHVLMVGDGLNDAAALARANASMAPGAAIDASQNAANLVFEAPGLMSVVAAIDVARAARARALENFGFSALYNLIAAPAAMAGLINPLFAALAMSASSLVVTLNALRMHWAARR